MLLELKRLTVPPGQRVILQDVTWAEFEQILLELGNLAPPESLIIREF
ncbi:hypothetical protein [[Phormidium] sp. ETS-05]